eukprot:1154174-Pelagomonas_calceolata.AAC.1
MAGPETTEDHQTNMRLSRGATHLHLLGDLLPGVSSFLQLPVCAPILLLIVHLHLPTCLGHLLTSCSILSKSHGQMNVAELWKAWAENVEGDFTLQIKAVLAIATAFFLLGQLLHKTVRVFPNDKDNAQAISRLVGYIHH